jgi:hypothetical protein
MPASKGTVLEMELGSFGQKHVLTGAVKREAMANAMTDRVAFTTSANSSWYLVPPPV